MLYRCQEHVSTPSGVRVIPGEAMQIERVFSKSWDVSEVTLGQ